MQQLESVVRQQWKQQQGNLGMVYGTSPSYPSLTIKVKANIVCIITEENHGKFKPVNTGCPRKNAL